MRIVLGSDHRGIEAVRAVAEQRVPPTYDALRTRDVVGLLAARLPRSLSDQGFQGLFVIPAFFFILHQPP